MNPFLTPSRRLLLASAAATALLWGCGKTETPAPAATEPAAPPAAAAPALPAKIVIGLDDNFPPMGFRDEKNELVGFDIDMAREAAKRLGLEVEFKPIDWSAKEAELSAKRVDALWNGLTITEERRKNIAFTAPYMENHQIIVVTAGSPIKAKADLAGKVVGAQDGSSAVDAVKKEEAVFQSFKELKTFGDNVTALMDLSAGRLEAVVVDEVVGRYYVAKKPDQYAVLDDNFGTEEYGVGVRKDDAELLGKLDKALGEMKADGAAAKIAEQWFGKNIIK
jgi:polar amino acid transport system substrate-binding protein